VKKQILTTLILFSSLSLSAFVGLADWSETTSTGTRFNAPGDGIHLTTQNHKVKLRELKKWYFYNGFIIGSNYKGKSLSYFILNESSEQIEEYPLKEEWSKAIADRKLKPGIWLREFSGTWNHMHNLSLALLFLFPLALLLLAAQIFWTVMAVKRRKTNYMLGAIILPAVFTFLYVISSFPQSL